MIGNRIDIAAAYLRAGEVVAVPTETVYGLACNALRTVSVEKVFDIKNRPLYDPLILHVARVEEISKYALIDNPIMQRIAKDLMPGPVTLLLKKRSIVPDIITSGLPRVAIRVPRHPVMRALLMKLDFPLAAPSANPFGYISPTSAVHVQDQLGEKLPFILDGGPSNIGIESTILGMEEDTMVVYRKGGMDIDLLKEYTEKFKVKSRSSSNPAAPGMLVSHYAPKKKFLLLKNIDFNELITEYGRERIGVLAYNIYLEKIPIRHQKLLTSESDNHEAAHNLYHHMRYLDSLDVDIIISVLVPEKGLGIAINDRIRRAASE